MENKKKGVKYILGAFELETESCFVWEFGFIYIEL